MVIHQIYIVWKCIRVKDMSGDPSETEVCGDPSEIYCVEMYQSEGYVW